MTVKEAAFFSTRPEELVSTSGAGVSALEPTLPLPVSTTRAPAPPAALPTDPDDPDPNSGGRLVELGARLLPPPPPARTPLAPGALGLRADAGPTSAMPTPAPLAGVAPVAVPAACRWRLMSSWSLASPTGWGEEGVEPAEPPAAAATAALLLAC